MRKKNLIHIPYSMIKVKIRRCKHFGQRFKSEKINHVRDKWYRRKRGENTSKESNWGELKAYTY